jgi:hypothetical protein
MECPIHQQYYTLEFTNITQQFLFFSTFYFLFNKINNGFFLGVGRFIILVFKFKLVFRIKPMGLSTLPLPKYRIWLQGPRKASFIEYFVTLFVRQFLSVNSQQILVTVTAFCDFFRRLFVNPFKSILRLLSKAFCDFFRKYFNTSLEGFW